LSDPNHTPKLPRGLAVAAPTELGAPTIMDAAMAAMYGARYVHAAAYAIDIDRYFQSIEDQNPEPLHWEIFLTECYLLEHLDPRDPDHATLMQDLCASVVESLHEKGNCFGSQVLLAALDAQRRGAWPAPIPALQDWQRPPGALLDTIQALFSNRASRQAHYAERCLAYPLHPPAAPPTLRALETQAHPPPG
jgi:hypothetical protein